jgi:single-stranded-DNA-specific exonuclease
MPTATTWRMREADPAVSQEWEDRGYAPILASLLAVRGVKAEEAEAFFDPSLSRLVEPERLPGITRAVEVILPYLVSKRKIVVFGDYDADGVCATAILVTALRRLGGCAEAFIPARFDEGYGMTEASLKRLMSEHPDAALVVTVDNGITATREVAALAARGVTVVVTDHHLPGETRPDAAAVVNPRVASAPGCDGLCGAGVAFFLVSALVRAAKARGCYAGGKFGGSLLVLAGLATVADLMPLTGQNRILVSQALATFSAWAPVGLKELFDRAARRSMTLTARDFAFLLVPRINAAGRMASAVEAYDLLMTADREEARHLAFKVDAHNVARKTEERRMEAAARAQIAARETADAVVVQGDDWHPGVAGIVAARIMETQRVPVAVMVGDHGSARAPEGYNVHEALISSAEALARFGGHAAAGGFTVHPGSFERFRDLFSAACAQQRVRVGEVAEHVFDRWVEPADLTFALHEAIARLEPFGEGNPEPVFGLRNVAFADVRLRGADGRHAALTFVNRAIPRAVWWNHGAEAERLRVRSAARFDVLFTLGVSDFGPDAPCLELRVTAIRPAAV